MKFLPASKFFLSATLFLQTGCIAPGTKPESSHDQATLTKTELYFGRMQPNKKEISEDQWKSFLPKVAKCFPQGFSVTDGFGVYRKKDGSVEREHSKIIYAVSRPSSARSDCIHDLKTDYKKRFSQESVLEVSLPVTAEF